MERSAWPKNLSSSRKHEIKELLNGQNPAKRLRHLFDAHSQTGNNRGQPLFAEDLIVNVFRSFSNTLSLSSSDAESYEVLQVPTNACARSEVSEGSESINTPPVLRRNSDTWTRLDLNLMDGGHQWSTDDRQSIPNLELPENTSSAWAKVSLHLEDGYQWRKYGEKSILNSKFPRQYFRCTHKLDQGCQATKQVQKTKDDPPLYTITYRGYHTCIYPRFGQDDRNNKNKPILFDFLSVKQEQKLPGEDDLNPTAIAMSR